MKPASLEWLKENTDFTPALICAALGQAEGYRVMGELREAGILGKFKQYYEVLLDPDEIAVELNNIETGSKKRAIETQRQRLDKIMLMYWPNDLFRPGTIFSLEDVEEWAIEAGAIFKFDVAVKGAGIGVFQFKNGGWVKMELQNFDNAPAWLKRACEIVGFSGPVSFVLFESGEYAATVWNGQYRPYSFDAADKQEAERVALSFAGLPALQGYDRQISKRP